MNRNSHLLLMSTPIADTEGEKENGLYSQALNRSNQARQSGQASRAPFGQVNF